MKLMIASDIHGSAYYCEKMIEAYKREKADKLLLLGDLLYHGRICRIMVMTVSCKNSMTVQFNKTVIGKNWEFQYHLVYFGVAVAADT